MQNNFKSSLRANEMSEAISLGLLRRLRLLAMTGGGIFFALLAMATLIYAQPISSIELIENAKEYNNKAVEYRGEVVGDVMARGDFAWVNLNDGRNAIGIWARKDLIEGLIKYKGGYNYKGDILSVKGIFHRACPQHGGDLDIHLDEVISLEEGSPIPHRVSTLKITSAIVLSIMALGLSLWKRK